eukprot:TRINITY_DN7310_c0_g1_i2.p1 TRINITY_DN7310_c0_g1~~TRINITY_DN7310_c0_g1_i2.p1  ORF type:complete len:154 (-),score=46.53 TRINITY_DN7310_c0_g1_i2:334-795(-)
MLYVQYDCLLFISTVTILFFFFFLMIRRPPRSTHCISSAASDVYKRQVSTQSTWVDNVRQNNETDTSSQVLEIKRLTNQINMYQFLLKRLFRENVVNIQKLKNQINLSDSTGISFQQQKNSKQKLQYYCFSLINQESSSQQVLRFNEDSKSGR